MRGDRIPEKYSRDGGNVSPPLAWSDLPPQTRELALIVDDPDAPGPSPFVHWVAYKIAAASRELAEGAAGKPPAGLQQGKNSFGAVGYGGPAPPVGAAHRYHFKLYALDHALDVGPGLDAKALTAAMEGHVLSVAELTGRFQRSR